MMLSVVEAMHVSRYTETVPLQSYTVEKEAVGLLSPTVTLSLIGFTLWVV